MGETPRWIRSGITSFISLERNVIVMATTGLLINFGYYSFQPFIPLYLLTLRANVPDVGIVFAAILLATILVSIPGGILADRFGRKTIIIIGIAFGSAVYFALLGASDWTTALLVLFAASVLTTLVQPASSSTIAESVKFEERTRAFGTFLLLVGLGLTLGPIVGGFFSYRFDILAVAIAGVLAALLRLAFLRETLPRSVRESKTTHSEKFLLSRIARDVWILLLALFIFNFSSGLGQPIYAIFSSKLLQLSNPEFGVMVGLGNVAAMLAAFLAGKFSRKAGLTNMMGMTVILAGLLLVPWLYSPSPLIAIGIFALSAFFSQFFFVGNQALMANITKAKERASIIGFLTTTATFGGVIGSIAGSQLYVILTPRTPFLISSLLAVAVAAPLALIHELPIESQVVPTVPETVEASCPHCGREVPQEARFCDMCGRLIHSKKCWGCGRELEESARFCDLCGRDQPKQGGPGT